MNIIMSLMSVLTRSGVVCYKIGGLTLSLSYNYYPNDKGAIIGPTVFL